MLIAQPLTLKYHTLRNRLVMASMHTGFEDHPEGAEHLAEFYAQRAQGGVALIITGGVAPNSEGCVIEHGAALISDDDLPRHRMIVEASHQHGAKICLQILHTGRYAFIDTPVCPSAISTPINPARPRALSTQEVYQTIDDFVRCAKLAQQAGYDGVEVMGSEGYLLNQFLAPYTNCRDDEFGGSAENRQKIVRDIVRKIRAQCGDTFLLIYRISLMDLVPNAQTWDEIIQLAQSIEDDVDIFNTGIGWHESRIPTIASCVPHGAFAQAASRLKAVCKIPVIAGNRVNLPNTAEQIIKQNQADMVYMARPFLADPQWVNKAISQNQAIAPCVGCNQACLDHIFSGKLVSCLVNPLACHEKQWKFTRTENPQKIAVIGAGCAGLAFAIIAHDRGHQVFLIEKTDQIGGQLNLAAQIPGKEDFQLLINYYQQALNERGITVQFNTQHIDLNNFNQVVWATGSTIRIPDIKGINHPKVLSYEAYIANPHGVGKRVAIIGAGAIGIDVAIKLTHDCTYGFHDYWFSEHLPHENRREVYLLQRSGGVLGKNLGKTTGWIHKILLHRAGVQFIARAQYEKIDDDGLHIVQEGLSRTLHVDNIIVCAGQVTDEVSNHNHVIGSASDAGFDAQKSIRQATQLALRI